MAFSSILSTSYSNVIFRSKSTSSSVHTWLPLVHIVVVELVMCYFYFSSGFRLANVSLFWEVLPPSLGFGVCLSSPDSLHMLWCFCSGTTPVGDFLMMLFKTSLVASLHTIGRCSYKCMLAHTLKSQDASGQWLEYLTAASILVSCQEWEESFQV